VKDKICIIIVTHLLCITMLDSVEGKVKLLRNAKKLAVEKGGRLAEGVYSPRLDSQAEGGQEATSSRVKTTKGQQRERPDHFQWKNRTEKGTTTNRDELACLYLNARSIVNTFDHFEAYVYDINSDIIGVTESWTGCHVSDMELALNGYDLFRQDRPVDRVVVVFYCMLGAL